MEENQSFRGSNGAAKSAENGLFLANVTMPERAIIALCSCLIYGEVSSAAPFGFPDGVDDFFTNARLMQDIVLDELSTGFAFTAFKTFHEH